MSQADFSGMRKVMNAVIVVKRAMEREGKGLLEELPLARRRAKTLRAGAEQERAARNGLLCSS